MALELNPYLTSEASGSKGGGLFTESPAAVDNIIFQTRGETLTPFEDRLADQLMAAFSTGAVELADVVVAMNTEGGVDNLGRPWTAEVLSGVLKDLGGQVFGVSEVRA